VNYVLRTILLIKRWNVALSRCNWPHKLAAHARSCYKP